jgi:hypothetical protein
MNLKRSFILLGVISIIVISYAFLTFKKKNYVKFYSNSNLNYAVFYQNKELGKMPITVKKSLFQNASFESYEDFTGTSANLPQNQEKVFFINIKADPRNRITIRSSEQSNYSAPISFNFDKDDGFIIYP